MFNYIECKIKPQKIQMWHILNLKKCINFKISVKPQMIQIQQHLNLRKCINFQISVTHHKIQACNLFTLDNRSGYEKRKMSLANHITMFYVYIRLFTVPRNEYDSYLQSCDAFQLLILQFGKGLSVTNVCWSLVFKELIRSI